MGKFEIKDTFILDGEKFQIISGSIHYFRIVPEYWEDRLLKLKAMGMNTVETVVPWNVHEPVKGKFNFEGMADIEAFVKLAGNLGLHVILRPSPYICAEWEFGGYPAWLLKEDGMRLRALYEPLMKHVREYYDVLMPRLTKLQVDQGGPVIMMQIENEYGYFGDDTRYMEALRDMMRERGVTVPLITSDNPVEECMRCGMVDGALPTGNFGSKPRERFGEMKKVLSDSDPIMSAEFWVGWFDNWGCGKHMHGNQEAAAELDDLLSMGSVNIYMFEGGTNFGFMNGSNYYDVLSADVTSYDYDALLNEQGDITPRYEAFKASILKHVKDPKVELKPQVPKLAYGKAVLTGKVGLFEALDDISSPINDTFTLSMEKCGQNYGYILYRSQFRQPVNMEKIRLWGANDRAHIFAKGEHVKTLYDRDLLWEYDITTDTVNVAKDPNEPKEEPAAKVKAPISMQPGDELDILVENMGRVNFGPMMEVQRKGIDRGVQVNGRLHSVWNMYPLPLDNLDKLDFSKGYAEGRPAFYRFEFEVKEIGDTFLDLTGFGKGIAVLNGFNLGRYWDWGPQKRLYIPGPLLKLGQNEIIVFETEGKANDSVALMDEHDIG